MSRHVFRFFIEDEAAPGAIVTAAEHDTRHLEVLRAGPGTPVEVVDQHGTVWSARVGPAAGQFEIIDRADKAPPQLPNIRLLVGILPNAAFDQLLDGAVQAGVDSVVPVHDGARERRRIDARAERLARLCEAAAKQAKRTRIPTVEPACSWTDVLTAEPGLLLDAAAPGTIVTVPALAARSSISLVVGGAEGVPPSVTEQLVDRGWHPVALGPWVMRSQVAAPAAVAALVACLVAGMETRPN